MFMPDDNGEITVPVYDHDLLTLIPDEHIADNAVYYEYLAEDGCDLEFEFDGAFIRLNGELVQAALTGAGNEDSLWARLTDNDILSLRLLRTNGLQSLESVTPILERVAGINPHLGLMITDSLSYALLDIFDPDLLFADEYQYKSGETIKMISNEKGIISLYLQGFGSDELMEVAMLPNLERLILIIDDSEEQLHPLKLGNSLESLTLSLGKIKNDFPDLVIFEGGENIRDLSLSCDDTVKNFETLRRFNRLRSLDLMWMNSPLDLNSLPSFASLESVYLPENINQLNFNGFVGRHPGLRLVCMDWCDSVHDISALKGLHDLDYLIMSPPDSSFTAESLKGLEGLEYLSIGTTNDDNLDSTFIEQARITLPNTTISFNTPYCLGSGYMLLVIPLSIFLIVLFSFRRKFF